MNNFKLVNILFGWVVFLISLVVYLLTLEPSVSLWDCGEFISAAYRLQVVHPPGAPLFLLLGRMFTLFATPGTNEVAIAVNVLSATASAFTVMFTYWIIVHFAKKITEVGLNELKVEFSKGLSIISAGLVGALTLTFIDTFWFSAVEAEVYASSSMFTAIAFWAILRWETQKAIDSHADRWLIFIAYIVGLAIGLHLLNLLVIPAVIYYYYFNIYPYNRAHLIKASAIGLGALAVVQWGIIPGVVFLTSKAELIFRNGMGLPFYSGMIFTVMAMGALLVYGIYYTAKNNMALWNTVILCATFIMIGYSSYATVVIRSLADPPIDMNNPEEAFNLLSYINREQYGDRPLLYGPYYNAKLVEVEEGKMQYRKGEDEYEEIGYKNEPIYDDAFSTVLPRMGDMTEKSQGYPLWSGSSQDAKPTFSQNMRFLFKYQLGWMYWRYFMWNFAGRQSDIQNIDGNPLDGNWMSGVKFIDQYRLGNQQDIPATLSSNKARNHYYFLPLILGILGIIIQFNRQKLDGYTTLALFLFTGILIIIYLNQPPLEPRERDYSHAGSFQTFCIWIGLGVLWIIEKLNKYMNRNMATIGALTIGLLAGPVLLASENWDDHDRSDRYLGISFAKNYLNSCAPNAILFTNGDNDTYPLWYAQNVEGYRTDVRIINMSLLSTDWYSNALRKKVFQSDPLPMTSNTEQMVAGKREYIRFYDNGQLDQNKFYPLMDVVKFMLSDNQQQMASSGSELVNYLPTKKFRVPVDKNAVVVNGVVDANDTARVVDELRFEYTQNGMYKGNLVVFDIIATNAAQGWERPIYFTTTTGSSAYLNLDEYFRHEGLAYRLVPIKSDKNMRGMIDNDLLYKRLMEDYEWGNMEKGEMFLDDKATLVPRNLRILFAQLARNYANEGNNERALELLNKSFEVMPESILPMDLRLKLFYVDTYMQSAEKETGIAKMKELVEEAKHRTTYFKKFSTKFRNSVRSNLEEALTTIRTCSQIARQNGENELADAYEQLFNELSTR